MGILAALTADHTVQGQRSAQAVSGCMEGWSAMYCRRACACLCSRWLCMLPPGQDWCSSGRHALLWGERMCSRSKPPASPMLTPLSNCLITASPSAQELSGRHQCHWCCQGGPAPGGCGCQRCCPQPALSGSGRHTRARCLR